MYDLGPVIQLSSLGVVSPIRSYRLKEKKQVSEAFSCPSLGRAQELVAKYEKSPVSLLSHRGHQATTSSRFVWNVAPSGPSLRKPCSTGRRAMVSHPKE